ncbi:MAG: M14 family metallopeptidase [Flavobacteriaceae bacterium]|nr:M14 family metallopeptidase [Flavobacteriaceae bacterium]
MKYLLPLCLLISMQLSAQKYFTEKYEPFNSEIETPELFLGYPIGSEHSRHDNIIGYFKNLATKSDRAIIKFYGKTHEGRRLPLLVISSPENLKNIDQIQKKHLFLVDPNNKIEPTEKDPVIINLAYNVHGNEPSSSEAAILVAYTLTASSNKEILNVLENSIIFIDPAINPDGRDRHTQWANSYKATPLVKDPNDAEHNENWPRGRTNHYWFDLNRDWLLAINPESQGKLNWYHQWYPNVVTDFHEMGSQSSYFFEPMKVNGSLNPIMPKENYIDLNNLFAEYFSKSLDSIGSLYFTKEAFDGTYPGYGSSYADLQGGLGILFEQASSRGLVQKTDYNEITFAFTIRNQYVSSIATLKASIENKLTLNRYQKTTFKSAISNAERSRIKGYDFQSSDQNLVKAFIDKLIRHKVKVYKKKTGSYFVPSKQAQYRMVQTFFETYEKYRDSVYYDASAWSVANFYNIKYKPSSKPYLNNEIKSVNDVVKWETVKKSKYAYLVDSNDYNVPALINGLQKKNIVVATSFKPFTIMTNKGDQTFSYGSLLISVANQKVNSEYIYNSIVELQKQHEINIFSANSGLSTKGIDLGSRNIQSLKTPKAAMIIGNGVRSYEAGEVWHLLDTRVHMPITKISLNYFDRISIDKYNVLVMVSGNYKFNAKTIEKIKAWISKGNTLITIGTANNWIIKNKIVKEELVVKKKDTLNNKLDRRPYVDASENNGREKLGGVFLNVKIDKTHPIAFGYNDSDQVVYKNNLVWLKPSNNSYSNVAIYDDKPHVDGYISKNIRKDYLPKSASLIVSKVGKGRVVMFADNPNFRGTAYGTNRLFLNAIFMSDKIQVPPSNQSEK